MLRLLRNKLRRGYFFGYVVGEGSKDMIPAVTGEEPENLGAAVLDGYELRIQQLSEVTTSGDNPRALLREAWGDSFKSYVLVKNPGSQVTGVLLRLSTKARHELDSWELIQMGWCKKEFVEVTVLGSGRRYRAETQVLNPPQHAKKVAPLKHVFWLMPKRKFLRMARLAHRREDQ